MGQKKNKGIININFVVVLLLFLVVGACSTDKNTFINRTYHSTTARYNGLFNAKELIRISLEEYRHTAREDFSDILPIELLPTEEDVVDFYPVIDTAKAKCEKVIQQHSMPTASKPAQKKSEHAKWIDQNWLLIGYADYMRRDYDKALSVFEYVRKFYENKPSTYSGHLWEVKTYIQLGDLNEARRSMQKLEQRMTKLNLNSDNDKDEDKPKQKKKKKKKSKLVKNSKPDKDNKPPELPKHFEFEFAKVKAMMALAEKNETLAANHLKTALKLAKNKYDKARLNYVIGQLLQKANDADAREYYSGSIKKDAPFEMSFNAKINRALISNLDDDSMIAELRRLAREERYLEFRDQIYYAMSKVELRRNDRDMAKHYLSRSVFYSLNNNLQKGMSYEKLGDLSFEEKNYVFAQRYYDSSSQVLPDTYQNYDIIKNKANKLSQLVKDIDVITFEDSVQMIAGMDESGRERFLKDVIKQLKKEEQERKEREALRAEQMRKLQQTYDAQNQKTGSKFYFSNAKAMQEGVEEFRSIWGQRENEDYWRLTNKPTRISMDLAFNDSIPEDSLNPETSIAPISLDSLSVDDLLRDIPLSDSAMALSNKRLLAALYSSGMIYKNQLEEPQLASTQFQRIIDKNVEDEHNVTAAFQLYKINEVGGNTTPYKNYILNNYPNSDYANYLRDPDYFVKKRERDALAQKDYLRSVTHFEQGLFYPVILKADKVIEEELDNVHRKEYFLLKAMAMGRVNADKTTLLPVLEQAIEEYPNTEIAERAQVLIDLIKNGIPPFEEFEEISTQMFGMDSKSYFVIVELEENQNVNKYTNSVADFNNAYFSRLKLTTKNQLYDQETSIILIREFKSSMEASAYIRDFKKSKRFVMDLKNNDIMLISKENFKTLLLDKKLTEYKKFYEENFE